MTGQRDALLDSDGHPDAEAITRTYWHPDGPHTPESVASAALAVAELTRYLARATRDGGVLPHAGDVYAVVGEVRSALGRLDQVLDQVSRRTADLAADPTLYDDRREGRDPAGTAREAQGGLDAARVALGPLLDALDAVHTAIGHLGHSR